MDVSYHYRHCAYATWSEHLPCWGKVLTIDILQLTDRDVFINCCSGHYLMWSGGPYICEQQNWEEAEEKFEDEGFKSPTGRSPPGGE